MPGNDEPTSNASSSKPEESSSAKGKGKAVDASDATKEPEKDKDGKPVDGKQEAKEEELSEEDQKLKDELDMLVERLLEPDTTLYKPALEQIKDFIKTSTSSMTAVPKPLKFLRPHYENLVKEYESWPEGDNKVSFCLCLHSCIS
jgi:26S proteasome regulatory subunit N1